MRRRFVPRSECPMREAERMWMTLETGSWRHSRSSMNRHQRVTTSKRRYVSVSETSRVPVSARQAVRHCLKASDGVPCTGSGATLCSAESVSLDTTFGDVGQGESRPACTPRTGVSPRGIHCHSTNRRKIGPNNNQPRRFIPQISVGRGASQWESGDNGAMRLSAFDFRDGPTLTHPALPRP